jgi:hypothetical protein
MEAANHARSNSMTVEGFEDVFASQDARPLEAQSQAQQSSAQALATAQAIARCLDVRSEAVIEHHKVTKPKNNKKKKKTVEEWRIKWTPKQSSKTESLEPASAEQHERGLFSHVSDLLRQNSELIAKLEAATYRIGYLESELENLRNQAGFSDCDAQVNELPTPKPAIRAISQKKKPVSASGNTTNDFWSDEANVTRSEVLSNKGELDFSVEPEIPPRIIEQELLAKSLEKHQTEITDSGIFAWLPPRA